MSNTIRFVPAGTVVSVEIPFGTFTVQHPGLVSDRIGPDGMPTVINASKRRERLHVEEPWTSFAEGKPVRVVPMPAQVSVPEMLHRARADLGRPWDLLAANCEHAVARWRGLDERSPQLHSVLAALAAVAAGLLVAFVLVRYRPR